MTSIADGTSEPSRGAWRGRLAPLAATTLGTIGIGLIVLSCAPAVAPSATTAAAPAAVVAPAAAPKPAASAPWLAQKQTFTLTPDGSTVTMKVQEQFLGVKVPEDATGVSKALTGKITLSPEPAIVASESLVEFDAKSLRTDAGNRDGQIRTALGAFQFPAITFVPSALKALEPAQRTDGKFTATLEGVMTIKGVEKPVSFTVTGSLDGSALTGTAKGELKMTDFGITPPKTMDILWVEELVRLEIAFAATAAG